MSAYKHYGDELTQAQYDGRISGLAIGREYYRMLRDEGRLSGPSVFIELDGPEAGYFLRAELHRALDAHTPRDEKAYAVAFGVNFCTYFDLAMIRLTTPDREGYAGHWYTPKEVSELYEKPYRTPRELADSWAKYRIGRYRASYAIQRETHPDWRLPFDEDGAASETGGTR